MIVDEYFLSNLAEKCLVLPKELDPFHLQEKDSLICIW
jgi:hypothetical protein